MQQQHASDLWLPSICYSYIRTADTYPWALILCDSGPEDMDKYMYIFNCQLILLSRQDRGWGGGVRELH